MTKYFQDQRFKHFRHFIFRVRSWNFPARVFLKHRSKITGDRLVSFAAVIRVVTHRSSHLTAAHSSSAFLSIINMTGGLLTSTCMLLVLNKGKGMQSSSEQLACSAGVLLGRVNVTTLRPPSVRRWGMGEGKSEKILFAPPPPLSFLLPIVHPLGRTFFLSPVFHCLKNSRWKQNFLRCELARKNLACSRG